MGEKVILMWRIMWGDPTIQDEVVYVSMAPKVAKGYNAWLLGVHPINLGMDEDEEGEEKEASEASSKDDPYQVNNPMHHMPVKEDEGGATTVGLIVLTEVVPLAAPCKVLNHFKNLLQFQT